MTQPFNYNLDWDSEKAKANAKKHGVTFAEAGSVFRDPQALSLYDEEHSEAEDRWVTLGISARGRLLVVHHTYEQVDRVTARIRVFSSRKASRREADQYAE